MTVRTFAVVLSFLLVIALAASALLIIHVIGLKSRVEISASELSVQKFRLERAEQDLLSAGDERARLEAEHDVLTTSSRVNSCAALHSAALNSYNRTTSSFPGKYAKRFALLDSAATTESTASPAFIDLTTESESSLLTSRG